MPHPGESKTSPRRLAAIAKQVKALDLRLAGATFDQIAATLNFASKSGAYEAVMAALKRIQAPNVETYRQVNLERLNRLRLAIWQAATKGDLKALSAELNIQEREARYLGLDAPAKQEITGADGGPIQHQIEDARTHILTLLDKIEARVGANKN